MPASTVIVQYESGSMARDVRVVLGFQSGQTKPVRTDRDGRAVIEHSSTGKATVYVNGDDVGSFRAPGTFAHTIK